MVDITITSPGAGSSDERALVDTGAAITIVPERLVGEIPLGEGVPVVARGLFNDKFQLKYVVDVTVGGIEFKSLEAIAVDGEALIGRNEVLEIHP